MRVFADVSAMGAAVARKCGENVGASVELVVKEWARVVSGRYLHRALTINEQVLGARHASTGDLY